MQETMEKNKEIDLEKFEDGALQICSYIELAKSYVNENIHIPEMVHIGLLIDKMSENAKVFEDVFDAAKILKKDKY